MTSREYLQVLKSWLLPAGLVLGLLCAAVFTRLATPEYAASTTMLVSAQGDATQAYQGNLLAIERVKTYTALIMSDRIRTAVSDRLRTEIAPGQITATAQPETVLITVTATDASPQRAKQIADAASTELIALVALLEQPADNAGAPPTVITQAVQPAQLPTYPISPRPAWNLAAGAALGLLLGNTLALLRHTLSPSRPPALGDFLPADTADTAVPGRHRRHGEPGNSAVLAEHDQTANGTHVPRGG